MSILVPSLEVPVPCPWPCYPCWIKGMWGMMDCPFKEESVEDLLSQPTAVNSIFKDTETYIHSEFFGSWKEVIYSKSTGKSVNKKWNCDEICLSFSFMDVSHAPSATQHSHMASWFQLNVGIILTPITQRLQRKKWKILSIDIMSSLRAKNYYRFSI